MMSTFTSNIDWFSALWLAIFCAPLLSLVLVLGSIPRRRNAADEIRLGNRLLREAIHPPFSPATLVPLTRLSRTLSNAELRSFIIGMRHLPFKEAVPLLRRQLKSRDPEIQLYAQCILQDGQSSLQDRFQLLAQKTEVHGSESPAIFASFLEAALALLQSPLTAASEQEAIITKMRTAMARNLTGLDHPRALHAAARSFLHLGEPAMARSLQARLPAGSPLHTDLAARIAHVAGIHNPPPSVSAAHRMTCPPCDYENPKSTLR